MLAAGTSTFQHGGEPPQRPDTSVSCRCEACGARFIAIGARTAEANLARHHEDKHGPQQPPRRRGRAQPDAMTATVRVGRPMMTLGDLVAGRT